MLKLAKSENKPGLKIYIYRRGPGLDMRKLVQETYQLGTAMEKSFGG